MLVVCDSMKIVEVPEEGRWRFIFRKAGRKGRETIAGRERARRRC